MNLARWLFRLALGRRLPITSGRLGVPGLRGEAVIRRDGFGIPHIEAGSDADAWFAAGFCQGQDRAFQVELLVRIMRGTLAEVAGRDAVPIDRLSRRIGFRRAAEAQLPMLDYGMQQMAEAFARGVTEGARRGCRRRAHEYTLLRSKPIAIEAADVLGIGKLQSFLIPANWDVELARLKILVEDGPEALLALEPDYPERHVVTSPPGASAGPAIDRLADDLARLRETVGESGGSNNWAVARWRTATGRPLLANDPHLAPMLPSLWYLLHIKTPKWEAAGASLAGTPGIFAGHNDLAAWGLTAGFVDNTDLFLEEVGRDGASVRRGDCFVPCEVRRELIRVRGGESVEEDVLVTANGPIIGPALDGEVGAISLRATWLEPRPIAGLLGLHRVRSFDDVRGLAAHWPFSSQNVVYADTTGTIGWQLFGDAPVRRKGNGTLPAPGWDTEGGWEAAGVSGCDLPGSSNPEAGLIASANNKPSADGDTLLGVDWIDGYRAGRIVEILAQRTDWDARGMQELQMDSFSLAWHDLRPAVLAASPPDGDAQKAWELLAAWDGHVTPESAGATVFEFFVAEMARRVVMAKAPRAAAWAMGKGFTPLIPENLFGVRRSGQLARFLREQPAGWFDRPWPEEVAEALAAVTGTLRRRHGADPSHWAWGKVRPLTLRHPVADRRLLGRVFNLGPFPWGGDANTVSAAGAGILDPAAPAAAIASLRMVIDVGDWEGARFVLPGGQSGNPVSPHYDDLLPYWRSGDGVPVAWSAEAVERATKATLHLSPMTGA